MVWELRLEKFPQGKTLMEEKTMLQLFEIRGKGQDSKVEFFP